MIVSLAGPDGVGKSTLTKSLIEGLRAEGIPARFLDRWETLFTNELGVTGFLKPELALTRTCAAHMPSPARFFFLMWVSALALEAAEGYDGVTVVDGHWAKHAAGEVVYGMDRSMVEAAASHLRQPGLTLYLDIDPEMAWERRGRVGYFYESGMDPACSRESFVRHQRQIGRLMRDWAAEHRWTVIDSSVSAGEVLTAALDVVRTALQSQGRDDRWLPAERSA